MPKKRLPDTFRPPGKHGSGKVYEPDPPIPRPPSDKPRLAGSDTTSCREVIDKVGGQPKYCPYVPVEDSDRCSQHTKKKRKKGS